MIIRGHWRIARRRRSSEDRLHQSLFSRRLAIIDTDVIPRILRDLVLKNPAGGVYQWSGLEKVSKMRMCEMMMMMSILMIMINILM